MFLFGNNMSDR